MVGSPVGVAVARADDVVAVAVGVVVGLALAVACGVSVGSGVSVGEGTAHKVRSVVQDAPNEGQQ